MAAARLRADSAAGKLSVGPFFGGALAGAALGTGLVIGTRSRQPVPCRSPLA
jgi:hypothetical protein